MYLNNNVFATNVGVIRINRVQCRFVISSMIAGGRCANLTNEINFNQNSFIFKNQTTYY